MYYIKELQHRPDGQINVIDEVRQTFASGMSYFLERGSKMHMTDLYTHVYIVIMDDHLREVKHMDVPTLYVDPAEGEVAE